MAASSGGFDWEKWLPLILGGGAAAGGIVAGKTQSGALDRASEIQAKGAKDALDFVKMIDARQRGDTAPYRAVGLAGLKDLQNWKVGGANPRTTTDFSQFKTTGGGGLASIPGGGMPADPTKPGMPTFEDLPTEGIHGRLSGAASGAKGGAGLGATAGSVVPGLGTVVGGGIGAVQGALGGLLFDNNNSDKDFASKGVNRVSDWTWNTLMPAVRSGQITPDDAEAAFNQVWSKWEGSMSSTPGFNKGVAQSSASSQRQYFQPFFDQINQLRQPQVV